jgi:hypothetical protein
MNISELAKPGVIKGVELKLNKLPFTPPSDYTSATCYLSSLNLLLTGSYTKTKTHILALSLLTGQVISKSIF